MTTAVASASAAPLAPPSAERDASPRSYPPLAPSAPSAPAERPPASATPNTASSSISGGTSDSAVSKGAVAEGKRSPNSSRSGPAPKIIVKKEPPASPDLPTGSRHRPRKLDLSTNVQAGQGAMSSRPSAGPLTSRDGGLVMQDVGLACLSPGFQTQDPTMREQLQRSISVRDQQRHIIESRLQKTAKPGDSGDGSRTAELSAFPASLKTPSTSKKRPPPGLSIVPPPHEQFANEHRVVQSAPLHQSFTGRDRPHPMTRHVTGQPSNLSSTSHIHHVPATQTNNRLPPIADVFASEGLGAHREHAHRNNYYASNSTSNSSHSNHRPAFPSPSHPSHQTHQSHAPPSSRSREYRSAEEAVADMSGGREDLLPRIIHYGGHQPPTPPSPLTGNGLTPHKHNHPPSSGEASHNVPSRRRARAEYERDNGSPPLGGGPEARRGPFGEGVESPEVQRKKKDEFLGLCERAWELFHS